MRLKRTLNGRPMPGIMASEAVAVDAVALLAGVNFGSVVKVFAAIEAIRAHTGLSGDIVTEFEDIPTEPVQFDGRHEERVSATDKLIRDIVTSESTDYLDYVLRHKKRFGARKVANN